MLQMRKAGQSNADRRGDYARDHNAHFIQYCFVSSAYKENLCLNSGLNTRYHGLCRNQHSRNSFQLKENQCSDFKGMDDLLKDLPDAKFPLGDKGCDSDKIRAIFAG